MKRLFFINVVLFVTLLSFAEKVITVNKEKIKISKVDSIKFNLKGIWIIVDRQYFLDDGNYSPVKWDKLDYENTVSISDNIFNACTYNLTPNLIVNPIFINNYEYNFSDGGDFFKQFNDTVLHISVWGKDDLKRATNRHITNPVATFEIYVLNNDYVVIAQSNSFTYLKRTNEIIEYNRWKKEGLYEKVNFVDNGVIRLNIKNDENMEQNKFIEFIFRTNAPECENGTLEILSPTLNELESSRKLGLEIFKKIKNRDQDLKDKISLKKLQSNIIRVGYLVNNINCKNRGVFLWRIVDE